MRSKGYELLRYVTRRKQASEEGCGCGCGCESLPSLFILIAITFPGALVGRGEHDSQMRRPRGCGHLVNYDARTHLGIPQILHCLMAANLNSFRLCIEAPVHAVRQEWVPKWSANSEVCLSQELSLWCTHTVAVVP